MITTAFIHVFGQRVGAVAWDSNSRIGSFEYDPAFAKNNWDLSPLKMPLRSPSGTVFSFPELRDSTTFKGLPGLLADVLPDKYGNAIINTWLARQGRPSDSFNPVELLCFIGKRGMGALEFEPTQPKSNAAVSKIEISSLIDVAEEILTGKKDFRSKLPPDEEKALHDILKIGTSAGGARAKAVIAFNTDTQEIRSGQADAPKGFTQWIIKFDGVTDKQFGVSGGYGRVEMAYHLMAKEAGIEMMECRLLEEHGRAHFMTRRFDRMDDNSKVHIQSFCAMQHYDFNEVNHFSYEQLFETMRMLGLPYPQAEQLYRRMVFNVLARNCDDHTKNFAFQMDRQGTWSLAPAFDVCHAYRPGSEWVHQQSLSANGKRNHFTRADLLTVAAQMNVKKAEAIIQQVEAVLLDWHYFADLVKVNESLKKAIESTFVVL